MLENLVIPDNLTHVTLENIPDTELWFLKEMIESGHGKILAENTGFGYVSCLLDMNGQMYELRYKFILEYTDETPAKESTKQVTYIERIV